MPEYRISVDPRNPGQYFACCGLFELAELVSPGTAAGFGADYCSFTVQTDAELPPGSLSLMPGQGFDDQPYDATLEPLDLIFSGRALTLNWWLSETLTDKSTLKTWGGQQTPRRVFNELLRLLDDSTQFDALFNTAVFTKSRFGVDARSAWEAIDAGYSPNDTGQAATTFPWVEILAVIGLQGFRPTKQQRARYRYSAWADPLPIAVARAACGAAWPGLSAHSFEFQIAVRGQGYKTFLFGEGVDHV